MAKKVRGSLYPSFREIELYRKNFVEGANLQGRSGLLYEVQDIEQVNTDEYYIWKSPVNVSYYLINHIKLMSLDQNPGAI